MRVAFMLNGFPILSETFILDQITGLIDRGVKVDIYAQNFVNSAEMHDEVSAYNLMERLRYPKPNLVSKVSRVCNFPYYLLNGFLRNPSEVFQSLNFFKFGVNVFSLNLFYEAIAFLESDRYDVIHAHFGPLGNHALTLKDLNAVQGKLVTSFHGYDLSSFIVNNDGYYQKLFKEGDLFLPISSFWKERLVGLGCEEGRVKVQHMGININSFEFVPRVFNFKHEIRFVSVARLTEKKGVEYAIRAVGELAANTSLKVRYQIIGDGPLENELQTLIDELNLAKFVKLVGSKNRQKIIESIRVSDVLLAPSVVASDGDMEGIPMVIMEAMAMGLPVVSTQHSGIPELLSHGETGFLVPERDFVAIASTLHEIINAAGKLKSIVENARNFVEENFNTEKQIDKLIGIYQGVLRE